MPSSGKSKCRGRRENGSGNVANRQAEEHVETIKMTNQYSTETTQLREAYNAFSTKKGHKSTISQMFRTGRLPVMSHQAHPI